jgi:hypothetical protein
MMFALRAADRLEKELRSGDVETTSLERRHSPLVQSAPSRQAPAAF